MSKGPVRRIRLRAGVAYPTVSVALAAAVALALAPFGPSQGMALAATTVSTETTTTSATTTTTPSTTTTTAPSTTTTTATAASTTTAPTPSPSPGIATTTGDTPVDHHVVARIEGPGFQPSYLPVDASVLDASQFQTFRVRFKFHNDGTAPLTVTPRLEYRTKGVGTYAVAPDTPKVGVPFHVDREWVPSLGLAGGTMQSELGEDIAVGDFRTGNQGGGLAVAGHHSMGANPDRPITLPPGSYTEQEFTVTLSIDAKYLTGYELRITDAGTALTGTQVATIRLGAPPAVVLSPDQHQGVAVVDPTPASSSAGAAYPLLSAQSVAANTTAVSAVYRPNTQTYPLTATALSAATYATEIHGNDSLVPDQCATCHSGHTAQAPNLLVKSGSNGDVCFMCHDGTAAKPDVWDQYYPSTAPTANDPSKREYYSHDAVAATPLVKHTRSGLDEFGGVSNRHSECSDCHNSHKARATDGSQALDGTGWEASGRLAGVSGVTVENGGPGVAPKYTFLSGVNDPGDEADPVTNINPITLEYQLCFKCHSGFTKLPSNDPNYPSRDALDKGVEFNPANASFHPIEAPGKNDTTKMTDSLHAPSPYKLWNFNVGSTIRCLNCHATSTTPGPPPDIALADLPLPGSSLAPHTSVNRGILLRNYQDRVLKATGALYSAGDFALCYVCHGDEPFRNPGSSTATNFNLHGEHLNGEKMLTAGAVDPGLGIDTAGAGQGLAICAECHFRIHSTTNKVGEPGGSRLVNFAPNVLPLVVGGTPSWIPGSTTGSGTCALTCHGKTHDPYPYSP